MVDEMVGKVVGLFKNSYGYALKIEEEENKVGSYFLNKSKSVDPLGYDLGFINGQVVHIIYWTTSSGNKMINNLKIITDKAEHLDVYDGEVINVYPELGGVVNRSSAEPPKPKVSQPTNEDNDNRIKFNEHYYLKENYFLLRGILEELRKLNSRRN